MTEKSPDAYRTISEAAEELKLPQHVLRFWETRFGHIKPLKRAGGRRYYRPEDIALLGGIRELLYGRGYTIRGVQKILRDQGPKAVQLLARNPQAEINTPISDVAGQRSESGAAEDPASLVQSSEFDQSTVPAQNNGEIKASSSPGRGPQFSNEAIRKKLDAALGELSECRRLIELLRAA